MRRATVYPEYRCHHLNEEHLFYSGEVPAALGVDGDLFERLWELHPDEYHLLRLRGKAVKTPRWQQAYGADYKFSGSISHALPVPGLLAPYLVWARTFLDSRLNGLLLNWYDGELGHYIGKHRDSRMGLLPDSPIVTISYGESRIFRMRPWRDAACDAEEGYFDFQTEHGTVFILPYDTNLAWTHEVPKMARFKERRISITIRAFEEHLLESQFEEDED